MNTFTLRNTRAILIALVTVALAAAMLMAAQSEADAGAAAAHVIGVEVETEMNSGSAAPGNKGNAIVAVLVTKSRTQRPLANVSASVPRNDNGITMPARVEFDNLTVPPGGCAVTPTQFSNSGDGVYNIRFVPFTGNANCEWLAGDYLYEVTIKGVSGAVLGKGLARLSL